MGGKKGAKSLKLKERLSKIKLRRKNKGIRDVKIERKGINFKNLKFSSIRSMTMSSIGMKISAIISAIVIVAMIVTGIFIHNKASSIISNLSKQEMSSIVDKSIDTISIMIEKYSMEVASLASVKDNCDILANESSSDPKVQLEVTKLSENMNKYFKDYIGNNSAMERISLIDLSGKIIADSDSEFVGSSVEKASFHESSSSGAKAISNTMKSEKSDRSIIVFTYPVQDYNNYGPCVGYIASYVYTDSFAKYLKNINVNTTTSSFSFLLDETGTYIHHKNPELLGNEVQIDEIREIVDKAKKGIKVDIGALEYVDYNDKMMSAYGIIPRTNWTLVVSAYAEEIMAPVNAMTNTIILIALIVIITCLVFAFIIARFLIKPIIRAKELVIKTSKLDLTEDNINHSKFSKDEIGQISKSVVQMRSALRDVVKSLINVEEMVNKNAEIVEKSTAILREKAEETSMETSVISAGIQETAATSEEMSASSENMKLGINNIASESLNGSQLTKDIVTRAIEIEKISKQSKEETQTLYNDVKEELEFAIEASKGVNQIHSLANAILKITEQTNLLALNAAIEAARAGEAGRGFAVVADEVRKLAVESGKTASNIQNVVKTVYSSVENLSKSSEKMIEFMEKQIDRDYERMIDTGKQYSKDADIFNNFMLEFSDEAQTLNAYVEGIVKAIEDVSTTLNEGSSGVFNISAKTEDIVDKIEEINSASIENKNSAIKLTEITSKFKL
jgi:methyl-accepting chemotaxis protein